MIEHDIIECLRARHPAGEWAFLSGVRNATGFNAPRTRTADAIALSLWPSRGICFHGFEVKSSRSDWLNELKQPDKAEEIARFCDYWWLVAGDTSVVTDKNEVPAGWGYMVVKDDKIKVVKQAPRQEDVQPMSKGFMASILKEVCEQATIEAEVSRRVGIEIAKQLPKLRALHAPNAEYAHRGLRVELESTRKELQEIKDTIGWDQLKTITYLPLDGLARILKAGIVKDKTEACLVRDLNNISYQMKHMLETVEDTLAELKASKL